MNEIKVNLENLTAEEREKLTSLIEKANKQNGKIRPDEGERFWYMDECGDTCSNTWNDFSYQNATWDIGNGFFTKEEAEFELEKRKVIQEIKDFKKVNDDINSNWLDDSGKYYLGYERASDKLCVVTNRESKTCGVYMSSKILWKYCIAIIGEDRMKKYYLEVE